ncbi:Rossmann-like and DUF2520 domain-containing protein [Flavobacterium sp. UBA6135]|uniref:Rossmann-like and DUF2520 domain-containing protein n=1 Tax=Flavobacterium sp. UBA6135 TaxID=1946553 RepID=UPI0025BAF54F|nr:DUF2520 domain-containing protein [Flavobacterium sp. UBA6135]
MISVSIIGSGNVAQHLIQAFSKSQEVVLVQVFARNKAAVSNLVENHKIISDFSEFKNADVFVIAVSDNAIEAVSSQLPFENSLVVHTSGSSEMNQIHPNNRRGVFYPLQTFTKGKPVDFKEIPICLESEHSSDYETLETLAKSISAVTYSISSQQRKALHVAAVFVCNFVNHLYSIGAEICEESKLPFSILQPLIQETANKIAIKSPDEAQTGPAKRGDTKTINTHLHFLSDENQIEIYKLITKSIIDHDKKL